MFSAQTYIQRRNQLKKQLGSGIILFPGNSESPMNYPANGYHFRQDSNFLYFWGNDEPDLMAIIDIDNDQDILFGNDLTIDDIIWMGNLPTMAEKIEKNGASSTLPITELTKIIKKALQNDRKIHYLPPYRGDTILQLSGLLDISPEKIKENVSVNFIKAVVKQRNTKSPDEIAEIEYATNIARAMHIGAMKMVKPGTIEEEIAGAIEGVALATGSRLSFPAIYSVHGEILHNHYHGNEMKSGDLVVNDSGAESKLHYASDITRTIPVNGKFTSVQKNIYNIVLQSQLEAIENIKPGIKFRDIHLITARVIASGLKDLGIMKGDIDDAVSSGAHALFFPHGLGHMMGLDVHDMENLGEDYVGYDSEIIRSEQFGLAYLRLGRKLEPNFVVTVEPGIYFIPALIEKWKAEEKFTDFINYSKVEEYMDFGGIRIEDDVLVTDNGYKVFGEPIPKTVEEIENIVG